MAGVLALFGSSAWAFSEGPPWTVERDRGCRFCHFDNERVKASLALTLDGLPRRMEAGESYRLTVTLRPDDQAVEFARAGFFLAADSGRFIAGAGTEANGPRIRSNKAGTALAEPGTARWTVDWQAPGEIAGPMQFRLYAVAANGDDSRLGDVVHEKVWELGAEE